MVVWFRGRAAGLYTRASTRALHDLSGSSPAAPDLFIPTDCFLIPSYPSFGGQGTLREAISRPPSAVHPHPFRAGHAYLPILIFITAFAYYRLVRLQ